MLLPAIRSKGEVFCFTVCFFCLFVFLSTISRQILHAGILWFRMCLLLLNLFGVTGPGGGNKWK